MILRGIATTIDTTRVNSFEEALKATPDVKVLDAKFANWNRDDAFKVMQDYLTRFKHIDAVWAADDDMAVGGVFHCLSAGLRPKTDLGLFGFNGLEIGQSLPQPLSTIRSNRYLIGRLAAEKILQRTDRPEGGEVIDTGFEICEGETA